MSLMGIITGKNRDEKTGAKEITQEQLLPGKNKPAAGAANPSAAQRIISDGQPNGSAMDTWVASPQDSTKSCTDAAPQTAGRPVSELTERNPRRGWAWLRNPFRRRSTLAGTAVQEEFVLDLVQVVRNDLVESDLSVRRPLAHRNTERPVSGRLAKRNLRETNRTVWARVAARLFGGRRTVR
jgi:hypothetical protein